VSDDSPASSLEEGTQIIADYVKRLPSTPGVYRMISPKGKVLYVGKAKNLKKRVHSYCQTARLPVRLQRMVSETRLMEFVTTHTEVEALLLEANLIKKYDPTYNVLLKDDKFFSYIAITNHSQPRLYKYRGVKDNKAHYFGPFVSSDAVNNSLATLYRVFKLRSCTDSYFAARKRPCLQYHIKRCSAPCVDYISKSDYKISVKQALKFLGGKSQDLQKELSEKMMEASDLQEYEKAAQYRDQIQVLTKLQTQQTVNSAFLGDIDVIAFHRQGDHVCFQVFFYRKGSHYGSRSFFPDRLEDMDDQGIIQFFLSVFYADKEPPKEILFNEEIKEKTLLIDALSHHVPYKVKISNPQKGTKKDVLKQAELNAEQALTRRMSEKATSTKLLREMAEVLGIEQPIKRIEVYDNSHISGTNAIGAMIVYGQDGFDKKSYRKFTIKKSENPNLVDGDDYGMMREVLTRRFKGSLAKDKEKNPMPDLLIIDGGLGQLNVALEVLDHLNLEIPILGIAKGPDRNAGKETFFMRNRPSFTLEDHQNLLYLQQRMRDEAHRFAIGFHRSKRAKTMAQSSLDDVPGIGALRKKALLRHFGSAKAVSSAGIKDLQTVEGISEKLAEKIYYFFQK